MAHSTVNPSATMPVFYSGASYAHHLINMGTVVATEKSMYPRHLSAWWGNMLCAENVNSE